MAKDQFDPLSFVLCVLITVVFQVISNFANDLGDGMKGTDNANRVGPSRAFQSGLLNRRQLESAIRLLSGISLSLTVLLLIYAFGFERWYQIAIFLGFAFLSVWAGKRYTMGENAYGYQGWGDFAVFIFFGLLAVLGTEYVISQNLGMYTLLPAISIGLLSTAVLNLNNMRDIHNDAAQGKNTLVVKMGGRAARYYHLALISGSLGVWVLYFYLSGEEALTYLSLWPYTFLILHLVKVFQVRNEKEFDPELKKVALGTFFISLTFFVLKGPFSYF